MKFANLLPIYTIVLLYSILLLEIVYWHPIGIVKQYVPAYVAIYVVCYCTIVGYEQLSNTTTGISQCEYCMYIG